MKNIAFILIIFHFIICKSFPTNNSLNKEIFYKKGFDIKHLNKSYSSNGYNSDNRIIGGRDAEEGEAPWIVSLQRYGSHICGGSILSKRWIITAAHCVDGPLASQFRIRYNTLKHGSGGNLSSISKVVLHPSYSSFTSDNDIALLRTPSDLVLDKNEPNIIELPPKGLDPEVDTIVEVIGWGYVNNNGLMPEHLQLVDIPIISRSTCRLQYGTDDVTDNMFCAGINEGGKDSCNGDSGGPLVKNGVLWGLVSWGDYYCGYPEKAGVYTRVGNYIDWIKAII